jgi:CDP-diacylglycerol--glycerol-3-phosphate 3-phosphatidyltransferase
MNKNENVRLKILLDFCRGTRGSVSSKKVLENFKAKYHNRCDLFLYHNPRLRGLTKKLLSERANEILGVMHMKIYIIDNDLIISGLVAILLPLIMVLYLMF